MLPVVILSFGCTIWRQLLEFIIVVAGGQRSTAIEVLVLGHRVAVLGRQVRRLDR